MIKLTLLFGKEEIKCFLEKNEINKEAKEINLRFYEFNSEIEKFSFIKGINEAVGWQEVLEIENY